MCQGRENISNFSALAFLISLDVSCVPWEHFPINRWGPFSVVLDEDVCKRTETIQHPTSILYMLFLGMSTEYFWDHLQC